MLYLIGVLLLMYAAYAFFANSVNSTRRKWNEENADSHRGRKDLLPVFGNRFVITGLGVLVLLLNGVFFWANAGTAYAVQYPWGGDKMIKTQGLKLKWWGRVIPLSYEISIQDIIAARDEDGRAIIPESHDGIYNREAQRWEFSDAIKADIETAIVVGVSVDDEEAFLNMADRNRSEGKLIYGRVLPNIDAALKNTCKLMDAQEYISGKASDFDRYFRDQLENGMYLVEAYEEVAHRLGVKLD